MHSFTGTGTETVYRADEKFDVVVLERKPGWARVALGGGQSGQQGSAWLPEPSGASFRAYADLVKESLAFLTEAWDGRVWDAPGGVARSVAFKQIHEPSGKPIHYEKSVTGIGPVDPDEIMKGYQIEKGEYVLLEQDEIDAVKLESKKTLELTQFVDAHR